MNVLVIPIGGQSSRFPGMRPKWMLTHPSGNMMITEALRGVNIHSFDKVLIIGLKEHEVQYSYIEELTNELLDEYNPGTDFIEFVLLDDTTRNQPETIYLGLKKANLSEGSIFIKDSDNYFELKDADIVGKNYVALADLHNFTNVEPGNKSYAVFGNNDTIVNIVEKDIISSNFCVGGYGFESIEEFNNSFESLIEHKDLYISHIIYKLILEDKVFWPTMVHQYLDWGTLGKWKYFLNGYKTLLLDIDGVIVKNSSKHFNPKWCTTEGITNNIDYLREMYNTKKAYIVLTTSRKEKYRECTISQLKKYNMPYDQLVMGLPHCKRVLINDYAKSNPYPSAHSINLPRNYDDLKSLMEDNI